MIRPDGSHAIPCATDPESWWSNSRDDQIEAAAACFHCPVRAQCRTDADEREEARGVWGGKVYSAHGRRPGRRRGKYCTSGRHEMVGDNVRVTKRGRQCRECGRERSRERSARRRDQQLAVAS